MKRYVGIATGLAFALMFLLMFAAMPLIQPDRANAQNTDCYHQQGGSKWVCDNGGEFELQTGALLEVQSGATLEVESGATLNAQSGAIFDIDAGAVISLTELSFPKQTAFTVGTDGVITPTGTYQPITAAAARGVGSIVQAGSAGDLLILVNVGANTITLTDTGTLKLSGNAALGQLDTIILMSDSDNWLQIAPEGDN